jgi:hypothetical protein
MDENRLAKYLPDRKTIGRHASMETRWIELKRHPIYFAGISRTWNGAAVAFCALESLQSRPYPVKAYRLQLKELSIVAAKENGYSSIAWEATNAFDLKIDEWLPLPVALAKDGFAGKYNAILRVPDIDGIKAYTLSTSHLLPTGQPSKAYCALIAAALTKHIGEPRSRLLLEQVASASTHITDNRVFVGCDPRKRLTWTGPASVGLDLGIPVIQLPMAESGTEQARSLQLGTLELDGSKLRVWVSYATEANTPAMITTLTDEALRPSGNGQAAPKAGSSIQLALHTLLPIKPDRLPGYRGDVPAADVVQVDKELGSALGNWALAMTVDLSAPLRVQIRSHVPANAARVAYGARTLLGITGSDALYLSPVDEPIAYRRRVRYVTTAALRWIGERVLGAPPVALRATEGLVGDDGRAVVRVDGTALDYLGVSPGEQVIVSWATRRTRARILLQTEETRARMEDQLSRPIYMQTEMPLSDPQSRTKVPPHLLVWVSPTVRYGLEMPPDTIVRLRRSLPHVLASRATSLSIPFAGLVIAALAVPNVAWWLWLITFGVVLLLAIIPVRLTESQRRRNKWAE